MIVVFSNALDDGTCTRWDLDGLHPFASRVGLHYTLKCAICPCAHTFACISDAAKAFFSSRLGW
jgi:hypothetical protein